MADQALDKKILDDFHAYLGKIVGVYEDLKPVIRQQIEIISQADIHGLDENLKAQQVLVQRTKDFDKKVANYIKSLGVKAETLTEFIAEIPEDDQYRFYDLLGRFDAAVEEVATYKNQCSSLLETKIYTIDKALKKQGSPMGKVYEKDASEVESVTTAFERDA